jgi:hypothetical protein
VDDLTQQEKLTIVDYTLCHLVTWLDGASLAQSLLINVYLHDPSLIKDTYLKYFSIAILKIADGVRNKIINANVFEEEDFQLMNYNFYFAQDIPENSVASALKACEDESAKYYRVN